MVGGGGEGGGGEGLSDVKKEKAWSQDALFARGSAWEQK